MSLFTDRHASKIHGILSYFDRVGFIGALPELRHADATVRLLGLIARPPKTHRYCLTPFRL